MKKTFIAALGLIFCLYVPASAQDSSTTKTVETEITGNQPASRPDPQKQRSTIQGLINETIFDDTLLLEGFTQRYEEESLETLLAMIQDETIDDIKVAAAVRAFRHKHSLEIFSAEKAMVENVLLRQLSRSDSAFIQVEIMHTLCLMDRYKYFHVYIPALIQKMDHYNATINQSAYNAINEIIAKGNNRAREARIVFNTLRKVLFLSRGRLAKITKAEGILAQKLEVLKWSIKVLGSQELRRLPKEVLNLL